MSNTQAALRAAKEVQADVLAPELYRQATEWFLKARQEYRYKDFEKAREYADKARVNAEQAEFEALKNGGIRGGNPETLIDEIPPPPGDPMAAPPPGEAPAAPTGGTNGKEPLPPEVPPAPPPEPPPAP